MISDMKEIWHDVIGYEGLYQVSNLGRVKSLNYMHTGKEKILKQNIDNKGYLYIGLYKEGKRDFYKIHRLVALAFLPNPDNLPEINHINEIKTDNRVDNLEWCSRQYNCNYGTRTHRISVSRTNHIKLSKTVICVETGKIYASTREVERELGFSNSSISKCCLGKLKTAYGFHWRYI